MPVKKTRPLTPEPLEHDEGRILSWAEVNRTHRIQNGVYQKGGRLISLLTDFGRINPCYPDTRDEEGDRITYTGAGRRGDQHLSPANRALLSAIETGHAVPLFNKLSVGRWQHMGYWRVTAAERRYDEKEQRMLWLFTLRRVRRSTKEVHGRRSLSSVRKPTL
jgi:hypothetical protein